MKRNDSIGISKTTTVKLSRFRFQLLCDKHSSNHPQIVTEDTPGYGEVAVGEATLAQSSPLTLLENSNACLGRSAAALQPREVFLFKTLFKLLGITRGLQKGSNFALCHRTILMFEVRGIPVRGAREAA